VRAKVLSLACPTESGSGLPVQALGAMSLKSLLFLIRALGRRSTRGTGEVNHPMEQSQIVELASQVLSDWPNNFIRMLDAKVGPASLSNPCKLTEGPLKGLYFAIMFGFKQREEVTFVRDELVKYAAARFGLGTDDRSERARILGCDPRYVTRQEIAERLGVDRRFANRILSEGSVETIRTEGGRKRNRLLIDMATLKIPIGRTARIYNTQEAADVIGIPRKLLAILRDTGRFETRYLPPGIRGFHDQDVEAYKSRLLNSRPADSRFTGEEKMLSLGQFLVGHNTTAMTKAMVIAEIHAGFMPVAHPPAKTVPEIQISHRGLASLMQTGTAPDWRVLRGSSCNLSNQYGGISGWQAAREIGCEQAAVRVLVQDGRLIRSPGNGCVMWVSADSVDTFCARFESLATVARRIPSKFGVLMRVCKEFDIPLLVVNFANETRSAAFIRREDSAKVISGLQYVKSVCANTRSRWERFAQMRTSIGSQETTLEIRESQQHDGAHVECAA
jgi:hypothetical protein